MSRWTVVQGATSYHVWFVDVFPGKVVATKTNAVDHREFYSFHQQSSFSGTSASASAPSATSTARSRPACRPCRTGPGPVFTSTNPAIAAGVVRPVAALSDSTTSTPTNAALHRLTPGFAFTGTTSAGGVAYDLYRVYVFSDRDCVNTIFRGAMVGSPAYVPRLTGPLKLPKSSTDADRARARSSPTGTSRRAIRPTGCRSSRPSRTRRAPLPHRRPRPRPARVARRRPLRPASTPPAADTNLPATPVLTGAPVDLWESGWPNGRFYWTVVPVR